MSTQGLLTGTKGLCSSGGAPPATHWPKQVKLSTAAAEEANPGAFGGLFGFSQYLKNKPGRKNKILLKKIGTWGPQLKYRCQSTAAAMEANLGGFGAFLAAFPGLNSSWAVKKFLKK